uniref:AMP-dependent synthetase/ligase domain-containing protein n=1 Tax=Trichuris muris TaxID=70415 RepID=A0A5S6Q786_TRIMR
MLQNRTVTVCWLRRSCLSSRKFRNSSTPAFQRDVKHPLERPAIFMEPLATEASSVGEYIVDDMVNKGDGIALLEFETGKSVTYVQLHKMITTMASNLKAHGVNKFDIVLLLMQNCIEFVIAWYGCVYAGATILPDVFVCGKLSAAVHGDKDLIPFRSLLTPGSHAALPTPVCPDYPATIAFSSGTTGLPKGLLLSHKAVISSIEIMR